MLLFRLKFDRLAPRHKVLRNYWAQSLMIFQSSILLFGYFLNKNMTVPDEIKCLHLNHQPLTLLLNNNWPFVLFPALNGLTLKNG